MPLPREKIKTYTPEDYWNLPEDRHAELIDGYLYNMAPPSPFHQELVMEISATIRQYIKDHDVECKVYPAPLAVNLCADDKTWVEPDISVICDKSKITDKACNGAPDWIIEVTSPSTQSHDYLKKLLLYQNSGVHEYWIVNPVMRNVQVYSFLGEAYSRQYAFDEEIPSCTLDSFVIKISDLI